MKKQKKKNILVQISTLPSPDSLKWAGQQRSILSNILLWGLWLCRVFSLLQICKLLFRRTAQLLNRGTRDKNASRINVPPMFCEIYFILWFCFTMVTYLLHMDGTVIRILTVYFLFESIVWVLYYTVFRRFYEENYSIYHELEYLTVLVLLIPSQAFGLANLYGLGFAETVSGLLGASTDTTPVVIRILGAMFAAIVISMIISSFPTEKVKKKVEKPQMHVLGCGDVVQKRLYPALLGSHCHPKDIFVYDLASSDQQIPYCSYYETPDELLKRLDSRLDKHDVVWIETPVYAHVPYLRELTDSMVSLIVLEKPITVTLEELNYVKTLVSNEETREKLFFLSYYILEKALPLYMVSAYNPSYERYLSIDDPYLIRNARPLLGALRSAEVTLLEGEDQRPWAFDGEYLGQFAETFVHNLLIASLFARLPQEWESIRMDNVTSTDICLTAQSGRADIHLVMKKNVPEDRIRRTASFEFSNGYIHADFDRQTATVYFASLDQACHIAVKDIYKNKYGILVDLVKRVERGERSEDLDGLKNQLDILEWIIKTHAEQKHSHK